LKPNPFSIFQIHAQDVRLQRNNGAFQYFDNGSVDCFNLYHASAPFVVSGGDYLPKWTASQQVFTVVTTLLVKSLAKTIRFFTLSRPSCDQVHSEILKSLIQSKKRI